VTATRQVGHRPRLVVDGRGPRADDCGHGGKPRSYGRSGRASPPPEFAARAPVRAPPAHRGMLRRSQRRSGIRCSQQRPCKTLIDDNRDCGQCGAHHGGSHKAAVATNQKPLAAARAAGKGPERIGMGTKRQSMAKSFNAQVLSRTRSSRKSTRAVEESLFVVLALDPFGLFRGEWRVGRSRLGVENRG
jgi:hypothetical protein